MPRDRSSVALAVGMIVVGMVSIQGGAALAKTLFPLIGSAGTAAMRLTLAALILAMAFRPWRKLPAKSAWPWLVGYGVSLGAMNLLFYLAIATVPLGVGVALEFTGPLALAVILSRRAADFLWVALAVAGLAVLLPVFKIGAPVDAKGAMLALGAGGCWALYIVFGQKAGAEHGLSTAAVGMVIAALVAAPVGYLNPSAAMATPHVLAIALCVAVLSSALPYSLEMAAMTRLPTQTFGVLMSLEPVFAALFGFLILGERLFPAQWLAIGAVIAASAGAAATRPRPAPA